ncbi:hypothetical protein HY449_02970 [Candidatus Pacearchaeota archaeon]|nr:hypothetical protein [Candidatus Pacearchaeota archaeon]
MVDEDKKEKILRLEYEHSRTYVFASFSGMLVLAFGAISNLNLFFKNQLTLFSLGVLSFSFLILLSLFFISLLSMNRRYNELMCYLKNENPRKIEWVNLFLLIILIFELIKLFQLIL